LLPAHAKNAAMAEIAVPQELFTPDSAAAGT